MDTQKYHIVSLKHTKKNDKYLTLWRPDNKGYCWPIALAGEYENPKDGYHNGPDARPIPVGHLGIIVKDDEGRPCYLNTPEIMRRLKERTL